jgi:hypothetical protein
MSRFGKLHPAFAMGNPDSQDGVLHALEHNCVGLFNLECNKAGLVASCDREESKIM